MREQVQPGRKGQWKKNASVMVEGKQNGPQAILVGDEVEYLYQMIYEVNYMMGIRKSLRWWIGQVSLDWTWKKLAINQMEKNSFEGARTGRLWRLEDYEVNNYRGMVMMLPAIVKQLQRAAVPAL